MYFEKVFKAIFIWTCFKIGMWTASNVFHNMRVHQLYINDFAHVHRCTSMYINRNWISHFVSALKCPLEASILYLRSVCRCQGERIVLFFISKQQGFKERNKLKFESRIAFCAPASYRGQLLCQFFAFTFHQVLKLESIHNHCFWWLEPSGTFLDWFWSNLGNFIFHHVWHVRGHFQKVFWEGPKAIFFCFASKLVCDQLQCFSNMSSELECDLDHFFMSWFRLACSPKFALKPQFSTFGQSGSQGERRVLRTMSKHQGKQRNTSKFEIALLSALLPPTGVIFVNFLLSHFIKFWSLNPFIIIVFDDLNLQGPSWIDSGQIWGTSFFIMFDMFGVIFKKYFEEGPKAIFFCFASKLVCDQLQCFSNMSSELECDLDHFHVLVQIGLCCPPNLRWSLHFLPSVSLGVKRRGDAPCQNTKENKETHRSSKSRCFRALASYRGQLLCQFFAFTFHQVLKLESIHNHCFWWLEPSGTFLDWFWSNLGNFIFHHVWHVRGHFQKVFWEGPKTIFFCFASKLVCDQLQCFSNMSSELKCDLDHFFMSWFRLACVVPQICVEASISTFDQSGGQGERRVLRTIVRTPRKTKKHIEVRNRVAFCFLRSCLLPGSTSLSIFCFPISSIFEAWIHSSSTFRDLPGLILVKFGELHFSSCLTCLGSFSKSILRRSQSNILLFCFKIGVWPT